MRRGIAAWCLYDFGVTAWPVVVATFVWGTYFSTAILHSPEEGAALWGATLAVAGLAVAILSPILGSIADYSGRRKPWLGAFLLVAVVTTGFLWFATPVPESAELTLMLVALGSVAYELGLVFYNAMLRETAPPRFLGRVSGWGWAAGYAGGLCCLVVALFALIRSSQPLFGLDRETAEHVRATALLVAAWMTVFAIPLFLFAPDRPRQRIGALAAVGAGLAALFASLRRLPRQPSLFRFLIARMIFADGLNTLFIFGGIYAAGVVGLSFDEVVQFAIAINATAGVGAFLFAHYDDRLGSKPVILLALAALVVLGLGLLFVHTKVLFWTLGLALGIFVGPAQAASRSFLARITPRDKQNEMFGLYALSGKVTAFMGPAFYGWATAHFGTQRAGMAVVVVALALGLLIMLTVRARPLRPEG